MDNYPVEDWRQLIASLIPEIDDDYRASIDHTEPSMQLTIGMDDSGDDWNYQTGDNSFAGGAYAFPHWAVLYIYRDSDPAELAADAADQIEDLRYQ